MAVVYVKHASVYPLVDFVASTGDWCVDHPLDLLVYLACAAAFLRFLARNTRVRTLAGVLFIFIKLGVDMCQFYGGRLIRRLKAKRAVEFTGDPNQPVMRRPMMRPPRLARPATSIPTADLQALLQSIPLANRPCGVLNTDDASKVATGSEAAVIEATVIEATVSEAAVSEAAGSEATGSELAASEVVESATTRSETQATGILSCETCEDKHVKTE